MSFNNNYDKVFLYTGILLGCAGIGFGAWSYSTLDDKYADRPRISDKPVEVPGIALSGQLLDHKIKADHQIARPKNGTHFFDIFVGPDIYKLKNKDVAVDIYDKDSPMIHPPIPNSWFIEQGLIEALAYSNALELDSDNDGFTNLEEFQAGTSPSDSGAHPLLAGKLVVKKVASPSFNIVFSSEYPPEYTFKATPARGGDPYWTQTVKVGEKLGKAPTGADRFVLKEIIQKEIKVANVNEKVPFAVLEDQKPSKLGTLYEVQKGSNTPKRILDNTVTFTILAGDKKDSDFAVEEGLKFKIPGDDKTEYTLVSVNSKQGTVTVELGGGEKKQTWTVKRAAN